MITNKTTKILLMKFENICDINRGKLPRENGIYFFKLKKNINLNGFENLNNDRIIYVGRAAGKSNTIFGRFGDHVENNNGYTSSSNSTFRRSLGAILKKELKLIPYPRMSAHNKPNHIANYNFIRRITTLEEYITKHIDDYGKEEDLTAWMSLNLKFYYKVSNDPKGLESELIEQYRPSLNKSIYNPLSDKLFNKLRKKCRAEAKDYCLKTYGSLPNN
ncbi:hypothetical protein OAN93_02460 [Candidatus Marinimicrobia bacterium]|nr:hypothetical protein [Candidatus Neomarinimicrobiota bacterium]